MISGLDPTKIDWNNPGVVYLTEYFEMATQARDEEIDQLKKQIAQLREENDQLKKYIKGGSASKGAVGNKRCYNVRNFKGYPKTTKSSKTLKTHHHTGDRNRR